MLKFAFLLDIQKGNIINSNPEKKLKKLENVINMIKQSISDNSLVPHQRIVPIKVNATTNVYGQVNEKMVLIGVFAASSSVSTR